jgi:hypothetical protein
MMIIKALVTLHLMPLMAVVQGNDDVGSNKGARAPTHDDLSKKVKRFNLHEHLMGPTKRDLEGGVENSRRLAKNAIRLGVDTETHRALVGDNSFARESSGSDAPVPPDLVAQFSETTPLPSAGPRVEVDNRVDALPFGDGPGVFPAFPNGTNAFWEDGGAPTQMWEVVACPVAVSSDQLSMNNAIADHTFRQLTMFLHFDFLTGRGGFPYESSQLCVWDRRRRAR